MSMKHRSMSGLRAKKHGDYFENLIMFFAGRSGFEFIKIPSGCKTLNKDKLIRVKSPFDFILVSDQQTIFCDAKSTETDRFTYSAIDQDQIRNLLKVENKNNISGYIINFNGEVGFAPVRLLHSIKPRQSISLKDCLSMGGIKKISFEALNGTI